jgi:uncharacterized membrane protein
MNTEIIFLKSILALTFFITGVLKIFGAKPFRRMFYDFKLNRAAMVLAGMLEIAGAVCLLIQSLEFYACIGLAYISSAALYKHIKAHHPFRKYIPAFALLLFSMLTAILLMKN